MVTPLRRKQEETPKPKKKFFLKFDCGALKDLGPFIMSVINVKVANIRPQHKNLQEWVSDPNNVYVGRAGVVFVDKQRFPKVASIWANPFKVGEHTREEAIRLYETYIRNKIRTEYGVEKLLELRGKHLGCWCAPEPCHADVLLRLIDEAVRTGKV